MLDLHKASDGKGDAHLCDFLEAEYLGEQVEGIKQIGNLITSHHGQGDWILINETNFVLLIGKIHQAVSEHYSTIKI